MTFTKNWLFLIPLPVVSQFIIKVSTFFWSSKQHLWNANKVKADLAESHWICPIQFWHALSCPYAQEFNIKQVLDTSCEISGPCQMFHSPTMQITDGIEILSVCADSFMHMSKFSVYNSLCIFKICPWAALKGSLWSTSKHCNWWEHEISWGIKATCACNHGVWIDWK